MPNVGQREGKCTNPDTSFFAFWLAYMFWMRVGGLGFWGADVVRSRRQHVEEGGLLVEGGMAMLLDGNGAIQREGK